MSELVTYSKSLGDKPNLRPAAERATGVLREVLGPSADHVQAGWDVGQDAKGRDVVRLTLRDPFAGPATAELAPAELDDRSALHRRLYRFWGDLLQARSHVQLQRLDAAGIE